MPVRVYTTDEASAVPKAVGKQTLAHRQETLRKVEGYALQEAKPFGGLAPEWQSTAVVRSRPTLVPGVVLLEAEIRTHEDYELDPQYEEQPMRTWQVVVHVQGTITTTMEGKDEEDARTGVDELGINWLLNDKGSDVDLDMDFESIRPTRPG